MKTLKRKPVSEVKTMAGNKWTKEQQSAIDTRNCNLLVAAAAGSGKTAVLVERILKIISKEEEPIDVDRLLVVTFTSAAAAEMRERIGTAISKALDNKPESKLLHRQLTLLNRSSITTMHSFCLEVIRNNFHSIDLDPGFRIADETEAILLKSEVMQSLFEDRYEEEGNEDFLRLVDSFGGGKDDSQLQDIVSGLFSFAMSGPWPEQWLREAAENFNVDEDFDFGSSLWGRTMKSSIKIDLAGCRDVIYSAMEVVQNSSGIEPYMENLEDDLNKVEELLEASRGSWEELYSAFNGMKFTTLKRCGKDADKGAQDQVKALRDGMKKKVKAIQEDAFFLSPEELKDNLIYMYPVMKALSQLVIHFNERYKARKKERGILDFNDLEHFCLQILTEDNEEGEIVPSSVALDFRKRFEEVLVDEYQDSNNVQEVIINMVSRKFTDKPNVFMVGDVKQSIYRFRQAKPELFLDKYNTYSEVEGELNRKIMLYKNFRSRDEVIQSVNFIFRSIMSVNIGELDYDEKEALNLGASYKENTDEHAITGGPVELHIIHRASTEEEASEVNSDETSVELSEEEEEELDKIQLEARLVVNRIKTLMNPQEDRSFKVQDKESGEYRPLQYKDIVILMRATSNWASTFVEELSAEGIPVYADEGSGYFQTVEVKTMMALLQIIDNPLQDIPMLSVLRSPIFSFTPEELIDIRLSDKDKYIYEAMKHMAEPEEYIPGGGREVNFKLWVKVKDFLRRLEVWREKSLHMSIDEFIWYLYGDTGYYGFAAAMPNGMQRQANLRILFQRARQYEETSFKGVFNFVNFINKLKKNNGDMGSAKILGENENVVRIMSIHKSKGLEFPVVILAGTAKNFNMRDMSRSILFHHDLGYGPDYVNLEKRINYSTIFKEAIKKKIKLESLSEEMRILYVAFTRAKEKLIITGCVNDIEKAAMKWYNAASQSDEEKIPEYEILKGKSYLDWIGPVVMRHEAGEELIKLSETGGLGIKKIKDLSTWELKIWDKNSLSVDKTYDIVDKNTEMVDNSEIDSTLVDNNSEAEFAEKLKIQGQESYAEEINRKLLWKYPFIHASRIPTRISVSELKRRANELLMEDDEAAVTLFTTAVVKKPLFLEETKGLSASDRGIAMHSVMQHLDLNKVATKNEIKEQIATMVTKEFMTPEMAKSVSFVKVSRFFESDMGKRVLKAFEEGKLYREVPFSVRIKASEVEKDIPEENYQEETILLQGVIDCYFEEDGDLVLLDYKTDYIGEEGPEPIIKKYETQIKYYTGALERITEKNVKERYLYLFSSGDVVEV
jgi:ATP-dependent helicase/nuclease subunit A